MMTPFVSRYCPRNVPSPYLPGGVLQHERAAVVEDEVRCLVRSLTGYASSLSEDEGARRKADRANLAQPRTIERPPQQLAAAVTGSRLAWLARAMRDSERPILVVEDDEDSREFLATFLRAQGYLVTTAANGEEALTKARQKHPRLILLDLMMPGMDGFAFRAAQLRSPEVANIPVILISGLEDDTQIARRLGPMAEVPKPINIDRLLEQVALYCERVSIPDQRRP